MSSIMLTTSDNPFDPFTDFTSWYLWDLRVGYDSCGLLARIAMTSSSLPDSMNQKEIERAIDEIVELNPYGVHVKLIKK